MEITDSIDDVVNTLSDSREMAKRRKSSSAYYLAVKKVNEMLGVYQKNVVIKGLNQYLEKYLDEE